MSVSTEVQRTLVKSPPELWSELSTPEGLGRHFGDLGEIRVTKVEPETQVEWEADRAVGAVQLKQSGWGTKVTLSLTREPPAPEPDADPETDSSPAADLKPEPAAEIGSEPVATEPEPAAPEPGPTAANTEALAAEPEPEPVAPEPMVIIEVRPEPEPITEVVAVEPGRKLGFFARLFKRKAPPSVAPAPQPEPRPEPEVQALAQPEPLYPEPPAEPAKPMLAEVETPIAQPAGTSEPTDVSALPNAEPAKATESEAMDPKPDPAADLAEIEARIEQEATDLLTGVLDRLGAAHHRPFSRG